MKNNRNHYKGRASYAIPVEFKSSGIYSVGVTQSIESKLPSLNTLPVKKSTCRAFEYIRQYADKIPTVSLKSTRFE